MSMVETASGKGGKTVVVTGGTLRVGKAIAERLRAAGWRVLTSSHRTDAGADVVADLSEPTGAAKLYAEVLRILGGEPPDALVNNAALFDGDADAMRTVNFESPRKLTMLMAGREDGVGAVVNILDCKAVGDGGAAATEYLRTKCDLRDDTVKAAQMFAATLRVNGVAPGPVMAPAEVHVKAGELLLEHRPNAADVADAVAYLLGADAVTGVVLPVDSGQRFVEV